MGAVHYTDSRYEVINLGNNRTVTLTEMIETIEKVFEKKAIINRLPMQPGDVPKTFANVTKAKKLLGYQASTNFEDGIFKFKEWFEATTAKVR